LTNCEQSVYNERVDYDKHLKKGEIMEIIAKTKEGCLIQASEKEIKEILRAVLGKELKEIEIGQKIPAIDYASTITKIKSLNDCYDYKNLLSYSKSFVEEVEELKKAVEDASKIDI